MPIQMIETVSWSTQYVFVIPNTYLKVFRKQYYIN
jgi:hypothetical protein